tara:strand:+ start:394 stop:600 length:207 start_codon:yes stop_codon:yes gene_type:complete
MNTNIAYNIGDLVSYREDLLGVAGYNGVVTSIITDGDGVIYIVVRWHDGEVYPELPKHLVLLAKAKNE